PRRSRTSAGRREPGAPRRWSCPPARYRSCPAGRLLLRLELDRNRVDAVAQPGGVRPVVEDMAQVATALRTRHFGPHHEVAGVDVLLDGGGRRRLIEARPAAVGVELGLRDEQLRPAPGAAVNAWRARVPVLARERPLGALLAQHLVLLRAQLPPPFLFGLLDFLAHLAPLTPGLGGPPVYGREPCRTVIKRATSTGETMPTSRPWSNTRTRFSIAAPIRSIRLERASSGRAVGTSEMGLATLASRPSAASRRSLTRSPRRTRPVRAPVGSWSG